MRKRVSGQIAVLVGYHITEERRRCPIRATMDVVAVGQLPSGERLDIDRIATTEADSDHSDWTVKVHSMFTGRSKAACAKCWRSGWASKGTETRCLRTIRLVRIPSTKDLTNISVSAALLPEVLATGSVKLLSEPAPPVFNPSGDRW